MVLLPQRGSKNCRILIGLNPSRFAFERFLMKIDGPKQSHILLWKISKGTRIDYRGKRGSTSRIDYWGRRGSTSRIWSSRKKGVLLQLSPSRLRPFEIFRWVEVIPEVGLQDPSVSDSSVLGEKFTNSERDHLEFLLSMWIAL